MFRTLRRAFLMGCAGILASAAGAQPQPILEVDFGIDIDNPPYGITPSAVQAEWALSPADWPQDDFYSAVPPVLSNLKTLDENIPGVVPPGDPTPPPTVTPALCLGRGMGEITDGLCFGRQMLLHTMGFPDDIETAVQNGLLFVQFCVETNSVGLPGTGVNQEQPGEEGGDVFQSAPQGNNILLVDEELCGLLPRGSSTSENDMNALVMPCQEGTPPFDLLPTTEPLTTWPFWMVDTDKDGLSDTPLVFFSVQHSANFGGADILSPGPQQAAVAWTAASLGLGLLDEIDALYIEMPFGAGPLPANRPWVYYSLKAGSPTLAVLNADPGDILLSIPAVPAFGPPAPPVLGPTVVVHAPSLGLRGVHAGAQGDDDLNALHITAKPFAPLPKPEPPQEDPGLFWKLYNGHYMPDFDQKQDAWSSNRPLPGPPWTWCGPVAEANSLWWFDYQFPTLVDDSLTTPGGLIEELATRMLTGVIVPGTRISDFYTGIKQYLSAHDPSGLVEAHWIPNPGNDIMPPVPPTYPEVDHEILRCQDVTLLLGFYQVMAEPTWQLNDELIPPAYGWYIRWWRGGGHYVTCAGTSETLSMLALSDPYFNYAVDQSLPVVRGTDHTAQGHNNDSNASHDIYLEDAPPFAPNGAFRLVDYPGSIAYPIFENQDETGHEVDVWDMSSPSPPSGPPVHVNDVQTFVDHAVGVSPKELRVGDWRQY